MPESPGVANPVVRLDAHRSIGLLDRLAVASALVFVVMLAVAAYWDSSIRLLHLFEAVPYLFSAELITRRHRFGHILGIACGAFWLWMAGFLTKFLRNGLERVPNLLLTGHVDRWDLFIAVPAALGAGGLALFSAVSYLRTTDKSRMDALQLACTVALVAGFFVVIFRQFAPQYLGMFKSVLPGFLRP